MEPEQIEPTLPENNNKKPEDSSNEEKKQPTVAKRLGIILYFRELSVVIIGVLITLFITSLISNYNRQSELDGMMRLVKEDLNLSLERLRDVQERWNSEQYMFTLLRKHIDNFEKIPKDTLQKYSFVVGAIYGFSPEIEAYDVLRGSTLAQYFKDKELMTDISKVYRRLNTLHSQLANYSQQKAGFTNSMLLNIDIQDAEKSVNGNAYGLYSIAMKDKGFRLFLVIGSTILSQGIFDSCAQDIEAVIKRMQDRGY